MHILAAIKIGLGSFLLINLVYSALLLVMSQVLSRYCDCSCVESELEFEEVDKKSWIIYKATLLGIKDTV